MLLLKKVVTSYFYRYRAPRRPRGSKLLTLPRPMTVVVVVVVVVVIVVVPELSHHPKFNFNFVFQDRQFY
jgi:hypothetical protein